MTAHESATAAPRRPLCPPPAWLAGIAALLLVLAGCAQISQQRGKVADEKAEESEASRYDVPTVGDRTAVGNASPMRLGGVGLVENLEGTGGDCPHDSYRAMLVEQMRKQGVPNVNKLMTSSSCAMVIVEALIPPGTVKGDKIDVDVKLPPGSKATSLRGGVLRKCGLTDYDFARNLNPNSQSQGLVKGHRRAEARGAILAGEDAAGARSGRIWQGAVALAEQPLALVMNPDSQQARLTALIMERVNAAYITGPRGSTQAQVAHTANNLSVSLRVPTQYRHNLPRFIRVVRAIPLTEAIDQTPAEAKDKRSYRQKLADDLLVPARTVVAAVRLEALGERSAPALRVGLKHEHPLVRFVSAEALAYLGSPAGCEELGRAVAKYPILRGYALAALASVDESASVSQLKQAALGELDDEARTGAYRALWLMNDREPLVRGERLNESFTLISLPSTGKPLAWVSTQARPEVVYFGKPPALKPPFSLLAGEYTVTATAGSASAVISWVPRRGGEPVRKPCPLEGDEVIRCMAEMGASFGDVLAMLQQAASVDALGCRLRIDGLPTAGSAQELQRMGRDATPEEFLSAGAAQ